jgi:hypothetical protein
MDMDGEQLSVLLVNRNGPQGSLLPVVRGWESRCESKALDYIPRVT